MNFLSLLITRILFWVFLSGLAGCSSRDITPLYQAHAFDPGVMQRIPGYDSLVTVIRQYWPSIQQYIAENNSFKYLATPESRDLYEELPKQGADSVRACFARLGEDYIYGFEVFRDSTIKVLVRDTYSKPFHTQIMERLSYFPPGANIPPREFPIKDTLLNSNWQYWILFDEVGQF